MRAGGKRTWLKVYPYQCIEGSIRYQLDSAERGVWYDLLCFSALCSTPGTIADSDGRPYPHSFIANRLNIPQELLETTLVKCIEEGRIQENETGIRITNWEIYQSEYQRQKPYRDRKKDDPDKYVEQKYGHMVARTQADIEKIHGKEAKGSPRTHQSA